MTSPSLPYFNCRAVRLAETTPSGLWLEDSVSGEHIWLSWSFVRAVAKLDTQTPQADLRTFIHTNRLAIALGAFIVGFCLGVLCISLSY